jgi:hypothetical protein
MGPCSLQRALAEMPTQVVQVLDFMEQTRMSISVALGHEEPPRDPSFEYRWRFQLGKPLIRPELVLKLQLRCTNFMRGTCGNQRKAYIA